MARATLRISNLPVNLSEDQLSQLFSQTEQFLSARLVRETPGVALIDYSSLLSAQAVKERYSGWSPFIGSAPIVVELQPAAMKPPGSAAYGGCWVPPMHAGVIKPTVATHVSTQPHCIVQIQTHMPRSQMAQVPCKVMCVHEPAVKLHVIDKATVGCLQGCPNKQQAH
jgi:hypothetical protein